MNCQKEVNEIDECEMCNKKIILCEECKDNDDINDLYYGDCSYINACINCNPNKSIEEIKKMREEQEKKDEERKKIYEKELIEKIKRENYYLNELSKIPWKGVNC